MTDVKQFFDNFYAEPNKLKQDAFILKHCQPKKVMRHRRSANSKYSMQKFQTKYYIYCKSAKKKVLKLSKRIFGILVYAKNSF